MTLAKFMKQLFMKCLNDRVRWLCSEDVEYRCKEAISCQLAEFEILMRSTLFYFSKLKPEFYVK